MILTKIVPIVTLAFAILVAELVMNLKTAKTLGLTIPPSVLIWADKLVE
jgi:hypothetical protein